jgi:DNA primase
VMIFLTTTAVEVDEELLNRCIVLSVNEDREQTRVIHRIQRERQTLEGLLVRRDVSKILKRHQNAQRLLRPLLVANPYAPALTFRDDQTRMRRDHGKYLTLIRAVALLRQYQRDVKTVVHQGETIEYVEVTRDDIREANRLAHEVLGRTLDELPPQTRRVLDRLDRWVAAECERLAMVRADFRFLRRDVRALGWAETQARIHLDKLVELEYVVAHRGTRGQSFVYELVYDSHGQDGRPFLMGLIEPDELAAKGGYDGKFAGSSLELAAQKGEFAGGSRPQSGPKAAGSRVPGSGLESACDLGLRGSAVENAKNAVLDTATEDTSYPKHGVVAQTDSKARRELQ